MDGKVKRKRNLGRGNDVGFLPLLRNSTAEIPERRTGIKARPMRDINLFSLLLSILILCQMVIPGHSFFFPKSIFRRLSSAPPGPPLSDQGRLNINNNNNRYLTSGSSPQMNFHVPKALCLACERFPWMPMSGGSGSIQQPEGQPSSPSQTVVSNFDVNQQPAKTIVINALGEAKEPPQIPGGGAGSRKPFAIHFDPAASSQNSVVAPPQSNHITENSNPSTRPITFQIYDPPQREQMPTVLKPVQAQQPQAPQQQQQQQFRGYPHEPAAFMQPPHLRPILLQYGRPTILQPVGQSFGMLPPPPLQAQQHVIPHLPQRGPPPPPKVPSGGYPNHNNNGPPPPIPPITLSTIVANQHHNGRQPKYPIAEFQPAKLVYQEHAEFHPPVIAQYRPHTPQNLPPIQYGKPFPPQNIKMPIIPRPGQGGYGGQIRFPKEHQPQVKPEGYLPPPSPPQNRPPPGPPQHPGGYLPPQQAQPKPNGNDHIINLRPPVIQASNNRPQQVAASSISEGKRIPEGAPSDYQQSGTYIQNQKKVPVPLEPNASSSQSLPKGVVKNPHIQSMENSHFPYPNPTPTVATLIPSSTTPLIQESGWEIIPAVQTDITHLFQGSTKPTHQPPSPSKAVTVQVPIPVPIPIPESHASKNPLFIVRNHGNRPPGPNDPPVHANIVVQGITYHEEQRKQAQASAQPQRVAQSQTVQASVAPSLAPSTAPVPQRQPQPQIPSQEPLSPPPPPQQSLQPLPQRPVSVLFRPHPHGPYDPLPPSISTALYHAQRTSYLTHQYLQNQNNALGKTYYVQGIPVQLRPQQQLVQLQTNNSIGEGGERDSDPAPYQEINPSASPSQQQEDNAAAQNIAEDQVTPNCQNHPQWVKSEDASAKSQPQGQPSSPSPSQPQQQLLMYYPNPTPVRQSSIVWVQQPQTQHLQAQSQPQQQSGIVRLSPQIQPSESENGRDIPVYQWSAPSNVQAPSPSQPQSTSQQQEESGQELDSQSNEEQQQSNTGNTQAYTLNIPFGQKLTYRRPTVTPFDIISVGNNKDEAQVQSLEDDEQHEHVEHSLEPQEPTEVLHEDNQAQEEKQVDPDPSQAPPTTSYIRPVSTTIIHSPESTSYVSQNQPGNFRPQKVIVHDFTKGRDDAALNLDDNDSPQEEEIGQQSQNIHSWETPGNNNPDLRPKSPKLVDDNQEFYDSQEEDRQSLSSIANTRIVQYQSPTISGTVSAVECATAHTDPLTLINNNAPTESPIRLDDARAKAKFRLGTRFPAGRPSISSFNSRPTEVNSDNSKQPSISVPVYEAHPNLRWSLPKNPILLDDIYKGSEMKQMHQLHHNKSNNKELETGGLNPIITPTVTSFGASDLQDLSVEDDEDETPIVTAPPPTTTTTTTPPSSSIVTTMSSSYSVSSTKVVVDGEEDIDKEKPTGRKVPSSNDGQKIEIRFSPSLNHKPVFVVTSAPVTTEEPRVGGGEHEQTTTSTTFPPSHTSTKIVKTVRVRQKMGSGSFRNKNRFNGTRVRIVHRPATAEYVRHFPELVTPESDKLGKQEEEEVKNALIELKRTDRAKI